MVVAIVFWSLFITILAVALILSIKAQRDPSVVRRFGGRRLDGPFGAPGLAGTQIADQALDPLGRPAGWIPPGDVAGLLAEEDAERHRQMDDFRSQGFYRM